MPGKIIVAGLLLALLHSGLAVQALAAPGTKPVYGPYPATVVRVIDGDTVELDVALWPGLVQRIRLRLDGVNTPEKRGKNVTPCEKAAAAKASAFTARFLKTTRQVVVSQVRLGKYAGRVLGRITANGHDLARALVEAGLARPYAGGKRQAWC